LLFVGAGGGPCCHSLGVCGGGLLSPLVVGGGGPSSLFVGAGSGPSSLLVVVVLVGPHRHGEGPLVGGAGGGPSPPFVSLPHHGMLSSAVFVVFCQVCIVSSLGTWFLG